MSDSNASVARPLPDGVSIMPILPGAPVPLPRPMPDPGSVPGVSPGSPPRVQMTTGTAGDDQLVLAPGGFALGLGGDDTFVLTSAGPVDGSERLGTINDFDLGDRLDLSRLGEKAQVIGRDAPEHPWGAARLSIDYDGDGAEDGFLLVSSGRIPDAGTFRPMPMPIPVEPAPGEFRILPALAEEAAPLAAATEQPLQVIGCFFGDYGPPPTFAPLFHGDWFV